MPATNAELFWKCEEISSKNVTGVKGNGVHAWKLTNDSVDSRWFIQNADNRAPRADDKGFVLYRKGQF